MRLYGRSRIYADPVAITKDNIIEILTEAMNVHRQNAAEIKYLREYVRGKQPILSREKRVRTDICNNIVVNMAADVVNFHRGYCFGEPVTICRRAGTEETGGVDEFNSFLAEQDFNSVVMEVVNDMFVSGVGCLAGLPNSNRTEKSPFSNFALDPATAFVIYSNDIYRQPMLGVTYCIHADKSYTLTAYTADTRFELRSDIGGGDWKVTGVSHNGIGAIPIVEYAMLDRSGVFEKALPLLDALNVVTSDRVDDNAQAVQSLLWLNNVDIDDDKLKLLDELLAIKTSDDGGSGRQATVKYVSQPLDQTTIQALETSIEKHILSLCGVPGREQSSGGSTGTAAQIGSAGWKLAEYAAKQIENSFKKGNRGMLNVALHIIEMDKDASAEVKKLRVGDFETKLPRNKMDGGISKSQVLLNLINAGVHPRIAFKECDIFTDAAQAYEDSKEYIEMALNRLGGQPEAKEHGDVSNQPNGEESMEKSMAAKTYVQKRD